VHDHVARSMAEDMLAISDPNHYSTEDARSNNFTRL
jgi:hypothetical protein